MISMFKDAVNKSDFSSLMICVESDEASFYRISKELFMEFVKKDPELQEYVNSYYRRKLSEAISRHELMTMNGKNGAVCAFLLKCSQFPSCVDFTGFNGIQNCVYCYYLSFFSKIALKHRPHYFHI